MVRARLEKRAAALSFGLLVFGVAVFACVGQDAVVPTADGGIDGSLVITDAGPPSATLPPKIDFGLSSCGGSAPADQTINITNAGGAELRISAALKNATAFSLSSTSASVPPGGKASFTLHALAVPATATAGLAITDTLFVTTNIPGFASSSIPVSITPQGATIALNPSSAAFGAVQTGAAATPIPITVTNTGNVSAQVTFGTPTNAQFGVTGTSPLTVAPGTPGQISVTFTASSSLPVQGTIPVTIAGPVCGTSPASIPISGETAFPVASVPTTTIDFSTSPCGGAAPTAKGLVVSNSGAATLHVTSASFGASSFTVTSPTGSFPLAVLANSSQTLAIGAAAVPSSATAGAAITDTLTLKTDDTSHATIQVPASITPQGATFTLTPSPVAFPPTVFATAATAIPVTLTNTGNESVIVTIGVPTDPEFTLTFPGSPDSVTVAGGASVPSLVAGFTPTQLGPITASTTAFLFNVPICGAASVSTIPFTGSGTGDPNLFDGGFPGDGCVPLVCSLIGVGACGSVSTCGQVIDCGACEGGAVCNPSTHTCQVQQTVCQQLGAQCGFVTDECGVQEYCGACGANQICDGSTHTCGTCKPHTNADCAALSLCGVIEDGCLPAAATIDCGACASGSCNPVSHTCNCVPLTCPPGACGTIDDGCGGTMDCGLCAGLDCTGKCGVIQNACGSAPLDCGGCQQGQACIGAGNTCVACTPIQCGQSSCGSFSDGCGGVVECPGCEKGICGGAGIPNQCGTPACVPNTCGPNDCGSDVSDGCTGTIDCSSNTCGDAGATCFNNACCTPRTCGPNDCGASVSDGCGGFINCSANTCGDAGAVCFNGACCTPGPTVCGPNSCGSVIPGCGIDGIFCPNCAAKGAVCLDNQCCSPKTVCAAGDCGPSVSNGCGGTIDCSGSQCADGQECNTGTSSCCTPTGTCGTSCSPSVPDGCGGTIDCSGNTCNDGDAGSCINGSCCTPLTCNQVGTLSCQPVGDNCGGTITCFACPTGSVCEGDGSCCTPITSCGAQTTGTLPDGCGGTIACGADAGPGCDAVSCPDGCCQNNQCQAGDSAPACLGSGGAGSQCLTCVTPTPFCQQGFGCNGG